jgi:recombinational DNA repair protein (RecF pathway)
MGARDHRDHEQCERCKESRPDVRYDPWYGKDLCDDCWVRLPPAQGPPKAKSS